jgi:hypothetical protein
MIGIDDAITAVATLVDDAVKRIWPDATAVELAKIEQLKSEIDLKTKLMLGQLDINRVEAASENWFTSGWRPYVGWVCGSALAYSAIIEPIARFIASVCFGYIGPFPLIDTTITLQVLLGMLGFGATRSLDKYLGTARK